MKTKNRRFLTAMVLAAGVVLLAGCGGGGSSGGDSGSSAAPQGEGTKIEIKATNWDFEPKEIRVKQGETVTISLVNAEGLHSILIKGYNQKIEAGKPVTFVADKSGEFEFVCDIMCGTGHADMIGKLIVE
ncbi:MAG TPA: cupredoxin domain-containing protein [Paenibacillaceae bacterium]